MKNVSNGAESVPVVTGLELKNDTPEGASSGLERVNVCLSPAVLDWLDATGRAMYRSTGWRASRSALLRAIIGAFATAKVTFTGCQNEAQVRHVVSKKLFQVAQAQSMPRPAPSATGDREGVGAVKASPKPAAPAPRPPQAVSGKTTVASTIVDKQDLEMRFDQLQNAHPIATWPQEVGEVKTKYLELVTGSPSLADSIEKAHAVWMAHWGKNPDGYIPSLGKWLGDGYHLKTPQNRAFTQNYAEGGR